MAAKYFKSEENKDKLIDEVNYIYDFHKFSFDKTKFWLILNEHFVIAVTITLLKEAAQVVYFIFVRLFTEKYAN